MNIQSINIFKKGISKSLGSLESAVMEVLWNSKEAKSARQVTDALHSKTHVSFNAITTVLNRLEKKKVLTKIASGKRYAFKPTISKQEYSYSIFSTGLASLLGDKKLLSAAGISGPDVSSAIDAETLSLLQEFIHTHETLKRP